MDDHAQADHGGVRHFYQLHPTIPLRSPKASGEAIAVIDMSIEHDLMWVIIDDATGEIWTVPNKDVRAYSNYSAGRNLGGVAGPASGGDVAG